MPSRNTFFARHRGYSDILALRRGEQKNFKAKLGVALDTEGARIRSGKNPSNPPNKNDSHWNYDSKYEKKIREAFGRL